ncbi:SRPBCC family protein [Chiayiivirga flava]|uniref:Uncharacterized protein YndB with AHSA1/START domain n=1 Tax=Chiayiivirga flava TaxID=659595 RepID=A0A7W8D491_9GAMM|nr:SRPBCC domain-containing protein [Chiayiivirga flava]MBB5207644.1 uncharacterized protein YndB with AHSA1/START domain [Chiayiivirga flava]
MTTDAPLVLRIARRFDVTPERVFDAWLDPAVAGRWLFATPGGAMQRVEIDARVGGGFLIAEQRADGLASHHGRYLELDRPRRIVFDFWADPGDADDPARVVIDIAPAADGCELVLVQHLPARYADYADRTRNGWTTLLANLARTLDAAPAATHSRETSA